MGMPGVQYSRDERIGCVGSLVPPGPYDLRLTL